MTTAGSSPIVRLVRDYGGLLRREPRARAYLGGTIIDDVGIAASAWAATLMMTNLATTQRQRASLMLPTLLCFLVGALVSGPLADWASRSRLAQLARWRWKIVVGGRLVETAFLAILVAELVLGPATVGRVLPYMMVSAFMKTALRATRIAFSVDLLHEERVQRSPDGEVLRDERGQPLVFKAHLMSFMSLTSVVTTMATLGGLLLGNRIMGLAGGNTWMLLLVDVLTNVAFVAVIARHCHPDKTPSSVRLRDLFAREPQLPAEVVGGVPDTRGWFRKFWGSFADGFRFLARPAQRPLLALLIGSWLVEVVTESFDGKMVMKHVLHAGDEGVRHAEIVWMLVGVLGAAAMPLLVRYIGSIGKVFLITMLLDGIVIAIAGSAARSMAVTAAVPFVTALAVDRTLTLASTTLTEVAQNSISSAAMRGRIAGTFALCVIVGDMLSEGLATAASEAWGIPGMIVRVGLLQIGLVAIIAVCAGRRLWTFGLGAREASAAPLALEATS